MDDLRRALHSFFSTREAISVDAALQDDLGKGLAKLVAHEAAVVGRLGARAQLRVRGGALGARVGVGHGLRNEDDPVARLDGAARELDVVVRVGLDRHLPARIDERARGRCARDALQQGRALATSSGKRNWAGLRPVRSNK